MDTEENKRSILMDNVKGILIISVVLGHLLAYDNVNVGSVFSFIHYMIYAVHMPMFIMISGLFSKGEYNNRKFISGCLVPYVTFDLLLTAFDSIGGGGSIDFNIFISRNGYWYILCIGIMRLLYSNFKNITAVILVSILGSVVMVYAPDELWRFLSLGRLLLLFPIFIIGTRLSATTLQAIKNHKVVCIIVGIVILAIEGMLYYTGIVKSGTHNQPDSIMSLFIKYIYIFPFTIGLFATLVAILPDKSIHVITRCGKNSIMVYLLHFFAVKVIVYFARRYSMPVNFLSFTLFLIFSIMLSWILSSDYLLRIYNGYVKKMMSILHLS